jgi:hypothetical protein
VLHAPAEIALGAAQENVDAHDGKGQHLDAELAGEELPTLLNLGLAAIEVLACDRILAAE